VPPDKKKKKKRKRKKEIPKTSKKETSGKTGATIT
jgi:hypothetical protein